MVSLLKPSLLTENQGDSGLGPETLLTDSQGDSGLAPALKQNTLVCGEALDQLVPGTPFNGYVGQVVTKGLDFNDLEGPVFGKRVEVYHNTTETLDGKFTPYRRTTDVSPKVGHYLVLYKTIENAAALSQEENDTILQTVPTPVRKRLPTAGSARNHSRRNH